jgi:hypothetical protein
LTFEVSQTAQPLPERAKSNLEGGFRAGNKNPDPTDLLRLLRVAGMSKGHDYERDQHGRYSSAHGFLQQR